ncbi:MAG TPA: hypothetical protein VGY54_22895 [Polyangiaceae bacterium]|nr:hypothetical protein [Polyangiaceae bacterium]
MPSLYELTPDGRPVGRIRLHYWPTDDAAPAHEPKPYEDPRALALRRERAAAMAAVSYQAPSKRERQERETEFAYVTGPASLRIEAYGLRYDPAARTCRCAYGEGVPKNLGDLIELANTSEAHELLMAGMVSDPDRASR